MTFQESEVAGLIFAGISTPHYTAHDVLASLPSRLVEPLKEKLARGTYIVIRQIQYADSEVLLGLTDCLVF